MRRCSRACGCAECNKMHCMGPHDTRRRDFQDRTGGEEATCDSRESPPSSRRLLLEQHLHAFLSSRPHLIGFAKRLHLSLSCFQSHLCVTPLCGASILFHNPPGNDSKPWTRYTPGGRASGARQLTLDRRSGQDFLRLYANRQRGIDDRRFILCDHWLGWEWVCSLCFGDGWQRQWASDDGFVWHRRHRWLWCGSLVSGDHDWVRHVRRGVHWLDH